ncbi:MAG: PhzF family phenazine biosynthesis protein [Oscillatoriales cyanobacterium RM2_1_1]|nr:PhzF family phenazine biosynthesis protein [Oscillatoriales cyanobacterium SM2_3_0]NJO45937.1 PhzF family phenazine biosynthesis protein [Oscillatoriales cyanobacterium RM2_1_1]
MNFYIVDVFAEDKYTGNPLAVVFGEGVTALSDAEMQQIAQEMNYSETTFVPSAQTQDGGYDVRIFTPRKELPFAGHPTLGTAYIIQQELIQAPVDRIFLNLGVGQIPVTWTEDEDGDEVLWMQQNSPEFYQTLEIGAIASSLSLDPVEIDGRFPIQEVSTGVPFIIVPLKSLAALKRAKISFAAYEKLIETTNTKEILLFSPEPYSPENNLSARMFAPSLGIPEDPATGSANGCLAGYLVQHQYFGSERVEIQVEQGYEINRPSILSLQAERNGDKITVKVGGKVVMVAKGELL